MTYRTKVLKGATAPTRACSKIEMVARCHYSLLQTRDKRSGVPLYLKGLGLVAYWSSDQVAQAISNVIHAGLTALQFFRLPGATSSEDDNRFDRCRKCSSLALSLASCLALVECFEICWYRPVRGIRAADALRFLRRYRSCQSRVFVIELGTILILDGVMSSRPPSFRFSCIVDIGRLLCCGRLSDNISTLVHKPLQ